MSKLLKNRAKKIGMTPESAVFVGEQKTSKNAIEIITYSADYYEFREESRADFDCIFEDDGKIKWINIDGIDDVDFLIKIGAKFGIHELHLEDIANTGQRPNLEANDSYLYVVLKMMYLDPSKKSVHTEQLSIFLIQDTVITFQERDGDVFNPLRQRIKEGTTRIRKMGADYLAYTLIDLIIDHYYIVLGNIGTRLESVEVSVMDQPTASTLQEIHAIRSDLIFIRKEAWPFPKVMSDLERSELPFITNATRRFIPDVVDHVLQIVDSIETFRESVGSLQCIYLSQISNKMNEVMKTLTIVASIFIPLTFIALTLGMNFDNIPELH